VTADIHGLSGAYSVDALDDAERADFERHLAECPECRAEVASLRETAAGLSALTQTAPPPSMRDAVLAGVRTVRPLPPQTPQLSQVSQSQTSKAPEGSGVQAAGQVVPLRRRPTVWFAGLAAAALLVVGGLVWSPWQHQAPPTPQAVAQRVLNANDAQRVETMVDGARATVVRSESVGRAVLVASDMPAPPPGKDYQMWLDLPGRGMVSAGLLPHGSSATLTYVLQGDATRATAAGMTIEPAGGSAAPTTTPLALFAF
jgi:anti-sigma-K factor RskA